MAETSDRRVASLRAKASSQFVTGCNRVGGVLQPVVSRRELGAMQLLDDPAHSEVDDEVVARHGRNRAVSERHVTEVIFDVSATLYKHFDLFGMFGLAAHQSSRPACGIFNDANRRSVGLGSGGIGNCFSKRIFSCFGSLS